MPDNDEVANGASETADTSSAQARSDDLDLQAALTGLAELTTGGPLQESLTRVAALAALAIPGADGAGLTMLERGRQELVVVSAPFVREVDDIQYGIGQGPCITAAAEARTVLSGSLGTDRTWPQFGSRVERLGVHSALSLPLLLGQDVLGALNIYAHEREAFDQHSATLAELFAVPAAVAVHNARTLMQAQRLAAQLQTAMNTRPVIDQAIGILISRQGGSAEDAFAALRAISQTSNRKLSAVAQAIVGEAGRRAQARHTQPDSGPDLA